jgi:hypothetical protein
LKPGLHLENCLSGTNQAPNFTFLTLNFFLLKSPQVQPVSTPPMTRHHPSTYLPLYYVLTLNHLNRSLQLWSLFYPSRHRNWLYSVYALVKTWWSRWIMKDIHRLLDASLSCPCLFEFHYMQGNPQFLRMYRFFLFFFLSNHVWWNSSG